MQKETTAVESQALGLPFVERAELANRLLKSLETRSPAGAADVEKAWIKAANRRYQALLSGEDPGLTHEQVFADLRTEGH